MKILGLKMYFGNMELFKKHIETIKMEGYRGIYFNSDFLLIKNKTLLKEISNLIKDNSLIPSGAHNVEIYPEIDGKAVDVISEQEEIFERVKILGVETLTIHFGVCKGLTREEKYNFERILKNYSLSISDYKKKNIEVLKILCEKAKNYSLKYAIENTPKGFMANLTDNIDKVNRIIREINTDNLGICFDTGHAFLSNVNLHKEILKCKNKLFEVHLHDNFGKISNDTEINDFHQPCGIGKINWIDIISAFKKINFKGFYNFELRFEEDKLGNLLKLNKLNWERFCFLYKLVNNTGNCKKK